MPQKPPDETVIVYLDGLKHLLDRYRNRLDEIEIELRKLPKKYSQPKVVDRQATKLMQEILLIRNKAKLAIERIRNLQTEKKSGN